MIKIGLKDEKNDANGAEVHKVKCWITRCKLLKRELHNCVYMSEQTLILITAKKENTKVALQNNIVVIFFSSFNLSF